MERDGDIYKAPHEPSGSQRELPSVDASLLEARRRARRATVLFTFIMVFILGAAWLTIFLLGEREEARREELSLAATNEVEGLSATAGAMLSTPEVMDLTDALRETGRGKLSSLDRKKLADAMAEVRIARDYLTQQEWDGAEIHAREALEIWPDMNVAYRLLGFVYIERGQFDQAIAVLEKSLESAPFSAETFNNLGTAYMRKWQLERAEELLNTALEMNPDFSVAHMNLGLLYVILGRYGDSIDHLERALEMVPGNLSARNNVAVALIRVNRYDEARKHLNFVIEQDPKRATAYVNMAITYVYERNFDEAMKFLREGGRYVSPIHYRNYLMDSDLIPIRGYPPFQQLINQIYPDLPHLPEE